MVRSTSRHARANVTHKELKLGYGVVGFGDPGREAVEVKLRMLTRHRALVSRVVIMRVECLRGLDRLMWGHTSCLTLAWHDRTVCLLSQGAGVIRLGFGLGFDYSL